MRYVESVWDRFQSGAIPSDASVYQRQEMKQAFYAGAHSILILMKILKEQPHGTKKKNNNLLNDVRMEVEEYRSRIKSGEEWES